MSLTVSISHHLRLPLIAIPGRAVNQSNQRLRDDAELVIKHRAPPVFASSVRPAPIMDKIYAYDQSVFTDIAAMNHA